MQHIDSRQLAEWLADQGREPPLLLDVRESWEYELCHVAGSRHLPMALVPSRLSELPPDRDVVVICHHGMRSLQVATFLERSGFDSVFNLAGGIDAWAQEVDPNLRRY